MGIAPVQAVQRGVMVDRATSTHSDLTIDIEVASSSSDSSPTTASQFTSSGQSSGTPPITYSPHISSHGGSEVSMIASDFHGMPSLTQLDDLIISDVEDSESWFGQKLATFVLGFIFLISLFHNMLSDTFTFPGVAAIFYVFFVATQQHQDAVHEGRFEDQKRKRSQTFHPLAVDAATQIGHSQQQLTRSTVSTLVNVQPKVQEVSHWLLRLAALHNEHQVLSLSKVQHMSIASKQAFNATIDGAHHEVQEEEDNVLIYIQAIRRLFSREQPDCLLDFADVLHDLFFDDSQCTSTQLVFYDAAPVDEPQDDIEEPFTLKYHARHLAGITPRDAFPMTLDDLDAQHKWPRFIDSDNDRDLYEAWRRNEHTDPVFIGPDFNVEQSEGPSGIGRPVEADMLDINFRYCRIRAHIPGLDHTYFQEERDWMYKRRLGDTGDNVMRNYFAEVWHELFTKYRNAPVLNKYDMYDMHRSRATSHRPAAPAGFESQWSINCTTHTVYLNFDQESNLNNGSADHPVAWPRSLYTCDTIADLREAVNLKKAAGCNNILSWLGSVTEPLFLDPHKYETCECCHKAICAFNAYRREPVADWAADEHHFPGTDYTAAFRPADLHTSITLQRKKLKLAGEESFDPRIALRTQMVKQCSAHETITDHLFVLMDSDVAHMNDQITTPGGRLPAPGLSTLSRYPQDLRVTPLMMQIGVEQLPRLAPRCEHEVRHVENLFDEWCQVCCEDGDVCWCGECVEHRGASGLTGLRV